MSYRSIKRVFGETSLERKRLFLLGICLLTVITSGFWWYSSQTDAIVQDATRRTAAGLTTTILFREHLKVLAPPQGLAQIEAFYRPLGADVADGDYRWKFIRPDSKLDDPPLDDIETGKYEEFSRNPGREWEDNPGNSNYRYFQAIRANNSCIHCHQILPGQHGIQRGNLMAVMEVIIPDEGMRRAQTENRAILMADAVVTVFISMIAVYFIMRYVVVKPSAHLRDASDEI